MAEIYNYKGKIVVYTAIFGGRDRLKEPPEFAGVDYVCFTDSRSLTSDTWKIIHCAVHNENPAMNAKFYKILPHRFFRDYEYSLWVDGTHIPLVDIKYLIDKFLAKDDIAIFAHHRRGCVYEEMQACIRGGKDKKHIIESQREKYKREGYPADNGLVECGVILRRHNAPKVKKTMEDWWDEINNHSIRDQLSFNYVAYRNSLNYTALPGTVYNNSLFKYTGHAASHPALSIGWILNGSPETASSRIMGYNVHDYLTSKGISSRILYAPKGRISSRIGLAKEQITEMLKAPINILVLLKIDSGPNIDYLIKKGREKKIKIVYLVCDMPSKKMVEEADAVIAGSGYFYKVIPRKYHSKLYLVFDGYEQPEDVCKVHSSKRKIKLCFVSNQVWDKFPCLDRLPRGVSLKIIGPGPDILHSSFRNSLVFKKSNFDFEYVYWNPETVYGEILECDVGIIPWPEIGIHQKIKTINRLVMFMSMGMPVIAGPIPSYLKIIKHKENGFIAERPKEWIDYIVFLRDFPHRRQEIAGKAREAVIYKYSKGEQGRLYSEIFSKILTGRNRRTPHGCP